MQTRSTDAFLSWLIPQLPQGNSGSGSGGGFNIKIGG
jgi:hypothetical protein